MKLLIDSKYQRLRQLVVHNAEPIWEITGYEADATPFQSHGLNEGQARAVERSLAAQDYQMVIGVPGSGKTHFILAYLALLKKQAKKVLLVCSTQKALDRLCKRLEDCQKLRADKISFVKVSSNKNESSTHSNSCSRFDSLQDLGAFIDSTDVFLTTVLNTGNPLISCVNFDTVIVN